MMICDYGSVCTIPSNGTVPHDVLQDFSGNLGDANWNRFHAYAKRVRTLSFNESDPIHDEEETFISNTAIALAALVHRFSNSFLPNLQTLEWEFSRTNTLMSIIPFVPAGLKNLWLTIGEDVSAIPAQQLLLCLADRTPELQVFTLTTQLPVSSLDHALQRWIPGVPDLQEVFLPRRFLSPGIVKTLGALPRLTRVNIDWDVVQELDAHGTAFKFEEGAFPALKDLDFDSPIAAAADLIKSSQRFQQLTDLCIGCLRSSNTSDFERLMVSIASTCPGMEGLCFQLSSDRTIPTQPIPFDIIRHLFPCKKLRVLIISHDWPMDLRQSDIEELGGAWPTLQRLRLCKDPYKDWRPEGSGVPVDLLSIVPIHLPVLTDLGIYLREGVAPRFDGNLNPEVQFKLLTRLDVGLSAIPGGERAPIAFFLASLLPVEAELAYGRSPWTVAGADGEIWDATSWDEVEKIFEHASRAKAMIQKTTRAIG